MKKVHKCPFCFVPLSAELLQSHILRTCNSPSDSQSLRVHAQLSLLWMHFDLILVMLFQENSLTSSQGNTVSYTCSMWASINHLEEEGPSPSIHEGKNSVGSCSQSVHCSSAHLHGPLGVQHRVSSPCSLCTIHSRKEQTHSKQGTLVPMPFSLSTQAVVLIS